MAYWQVPSPGRLGAACWPSRWPASFTHLRRAAWSSGRKLTEVARGVAAGLPCPESDGPEASKHQAE
jgi:hypothetical protein